MYYLCYKSELALKTSEEELIKILQVAQANNLKNQVTGMLLYIDNHFIQLIEGEKETIKNLFKKIAIDKRHYGVKILSEGDVPKRFFPNWIMGFRALSPQDLKDMAEMNGLKELSIESLLDEATPHISIEFLKSFYKNGELDFYKFWRNK